MMVKTILEPRFDSKKSFYGKAYILNNAKEDIKELYSYNTLVCKIIKNKVSLIALGYSMTTNRHIKEFLLQFGFKADSKKQMGEDYHNRVA